MSPHNKIVDYDLYRKIVQKDLQQDKYLSCWLEDWSTQESARNNKLNPPWQKSNRIFLNFSDAFYNVLTWYKTHKINIDEEALVFSLDKSVINNIKKQLEILVKSSLDELGPEKRNELKNYDLNALSKYTAVDILFQNLSGRKITNVLDFGAGIGRQALYWACQNNVNYYAVDAVEKLYILQNHIFNILFPGKVKEYFCDVNSFTKASLVNPKENVVHLPTWKMDLLPDDHFDLVVAVQVLQEINEVTIKYVLSQFKRICKKGGQLYIRDNEFWSPEHKLRVGRELLKQGWTLFYRYNYNQLEGVPRIWVFTGKDNRKDFKHLVRLKRIFLPSWPFHKRSWKDYGLPI